MAKFFKSIGRSLKKAFGNKYDHKAFNFAREQTPDLTAPWSPYMTQATEAREGGARLGGTGFGLLDKGAGAYQDYLDKLQSAASGTAPSAAELMLRKGSQANIANQNSIAAAARGNPASAYRQAAQNSAILGQQTAMDAAILRAQEMAQARGEYGQGIGLGVEGGGNLAYQGSVQTPYNLAGQYADVAQNQQNIIAGIAANRAGGAENATGRSLKALGAVPKTIASIFSRQAG